MKKIVVDYLYIDQSVCERCQDTDINLILAVSDAIPVAKTFDYEIELNKILINSKDMAVQYKLESSPTIRVNNIDIAGVVEENDCADCGSISGTNTDCRVFTYGGETFLAPPKEMITEAIIKACKGELKEQSNKAYILPANLENFFDGKCCDTGCGC